MFYNQLCGAPNSLRYFLFGAKELGNEWLKGLLEVDRGIMDMPVTIRKIHQKMDSRRLLELGVRSQETSHVSAQVVHESSRGGTV